MQPNGKTKIEKKNFFNEKKIVGEGKEKGACQACQWKRPNNLHSSFKECFVDPIRVVAVAVVVRSTGNEFVMKEHET